MSLSKVRVGELLALGERQLLGQRDRRGARQLCVDQLTQEAKRERAVEDAAECQHVEQE